MRCFSIPFNCLLDAAAKYKGKMGTIAFSIIALEAQISRCTNQRKHYTEVFNDQLISTINDIIKTLFCRAFLGSYRCTLFIKSYVKMLKKWKSTTNKISIKCPVSQCPKLYCIFCTCTVYHRYEQMALRNRNQEREKAVQKRCCIKALHLINRRNWMWMHSVELEIVWYNKFV